MKKIFPLLLVLSLLFNVNALAEDYDLDTFLSLVEKHSKELKLAQKEQDMASANKKEAISTALPHISAAGTYTRNLKDIYMYMDLSALSEDGEGGTEKFKMNRDNEYGFNVALQQTLFSFSVQNAITAAKQYQKMTDFIYDASYQEIITYSKQAFYQTLLLKVVWEVSQASEQNAYENYMDVKNSYDNGLASEYDFLQAEVRYKDIIPQTTEAKKNYEIALISLKNLAGIPIDQEIRLVGGLDSYPEIPPTVDMASVLQNRPDYKALLWEEKLLNTGVKAERANYYPSLMGSFVYAYSSQSDGWDFEEENNSYTVGLNLSIPIFTGGATQAKVQQARIELDKTRINIDRTEENIETEITNIRLRLEEAYKRIVSAEATLKTARKAFAIAEATSKSGLITQLELKDSRIMLDQATTGYYSAIFEYLAAYFDWDKAIGNVALGS